MRELPLVLPLRLWGIAHSSLQKRHQARSARVRRHTVFDNLVPLAEHSADTLVPPCHQTPAQCGFSRSHLLVICAAIRKNGVITQYGVITQFPKNGR
jgi:hypothetical protein